MEGLASIALLGGLLLVVTVMYGKQSKKLGEGDLKVIKDAAKKREDLESGIADNRRMSLRDKLKWLRKWAGHKEV